MNRGRPHEVPPLPEKLLAMNDCRGRESAFFKGIVDNFNPCTDRATGFNELGGGAGKGTQDTNMKLELDVGKWSGGQGRKWREELGLDLIKTHHMHI